MMARLFRYPKAKHVRRHCPAKTYKNYRSYKKYLRKEFKGQCVYCLLPDAPKGRESFGVDHYRPVHLFMNLETNYDNLFYACNICNSRKRDFWPSEQQFAQGVFIPNPCDHEMFSHMRYRGPSIEARSTAGQWTVDLLDLNDDSIVAYRSRLLAVYERLMRELSGWEATLSTIRTKLANAGSQDEKNRYSSALQDAEVEIMNLIDCLRFIIPEVDN